MKCRNCHSKLIPVFIASDALSMLSSPTAVCPSRDCGQYRVVVFTGEIYDPVTPDDLKR